MSIIGIDFGNECCYVAAAKAGGIEILTNDYSLRATPSQIAFSSKNRVLGVAAKGQQISNIKNTIFNFKRLLGRCYDDPMVQAELKYLPFQVIRNENGSIGIQVNYLNETQVFSPEQCTAMLFSKLRETASVALQIPVNDCVISVPSYFTNNERQALLNAVEIAGLHCLRLLNETSATGLYYGIYKQDLPNVNEKPRHVVFVDMGHSALQVFVCAFNRGKLKVISCENDPSIGGRNIDSILADHFADDFRKRFGIDIKSNARAYLRLLTEVEKLKKQMSTISTRLPINIECIMDEKDVSGNIQRSDMEKLCADLINRIETIFVKCLQDSKLTTENIHSVEIVGGSTRVPFVKALIEKVFKKVPSTTLNQDEAVSRGCALQCAILSPSVKVREYEIQDIQLYPISLSYEENSSCYQVELFPANHPIPFTKVLTLSRNKDFSVMTTYSGPIPYPDNVICQWNIKNIKAVDEPRKIKLRFRIDQNGILVLKSAIYYERVSVDEATDEMEIESAAANPNSPNSNNEKVSDTETSESTHGNSMDVEVNSNEQSSVNSDDKEPTKKKRTQLLPFNLAIEALYSGIMLGNVNLCVEEECKMIASDKLEKERVDSKNALEEYVLELRNKVNNEEDLFHYLPAKDRSDLVARLDETEKWLYDDGEECNRKTYFDKLENLKKQGEPIKQRKYEFEMRPKLFEEFSSILQLGQKFVEKCKQDDSNYAHITPDEINMVQNAIDDKSKWVNETRIELSRLQQHENPTISINQIIAEKQNFEKVINPIIQKPVPTVKTESEHKEDEQAMSAGGESCQFNQQNQTDHQQDQTQKSDQHATNNGTQKPMETD